MMDVEKKTLILKKPFRFEKEEDSKYHSFEGPFSLLSLWTNESEYYITNSNLLEVVDPSETKTNKMEPIKFQK